MIQARVHYQHKGKKTQEFVARNKHELKFLIFLYAMNSSNKKYFIPNSIDISSGNKIVKDLFSVPSNGSVDYIITPRHDLHGCWKFVS